MSSFWSKKRTKEKLKQNINYYQNKTHLIIDGRFSESSYQAKELWLFSRNTEEKFKIDEITPDNNFTFEVSLEGLFKTLINSNENALDWYLKIRIPYEELNAYNKNPNHVIQMEENDVLYGEYFIRLGRFQHTKVEGLSFYYKNNNYLINYITIKGNLSILINEEPNSPIKMQIDKLKKDKHILRVEGKIFSRNSLINKAEIILKGRDTKQELHSHSININSLIEETQLKYGLNRYMYKAEIDLLKMNRGNVLEDDIYDLYLSLDLHDKNESALVRVGRPTFRAKLFLKELFIKTEDQANIVNPYYTFKKFNLSFEVYRFSIESYNYLRKVMRWSWFIRVLNRNKNIWLIGERTYKAQDTGYAFFRYMRLNHPDMNVYYVIDKESPERRNVEKYGNVIFYKSKEHIWNTLIAKKVISSHHPDYLYPIRTPLFKRKVKATKVFLQHGVMGTKNMVANYGKNAIGFDTDLFMVSSDFEKEIIVNDFGYNPDEVFVTGLSRFDTLFDGKGKTKRQIVIIPTWRDWIVTDEAFLDSEYYERYKNLVNSKSLQKLSKENKFDIIFCLHPNMQKFSKYFENDFVKIINQGEIDVQHLIKESALMITDYSSVGFDFSFLHKPVIYYQFDRNRFFRKKSHLDLDNDLPGEICFEEEEVLQLVEDYAKGNFQMKPMYRERANKFIKYRDTSSSKRIYEVIKNNNVKRSRFETTRFKLLAQALFNKFRKSKYYFPTMKLFYKVGSRLIPVDKKLIVFESGLGKQLGDSPKNIYDEILRQGLDYKKVWIYNKEYRFTDNKTKKVKRLSPQYYYYLIRAKYWVNNQNFPTYIKKRPETIYLQTWHGTPLKKMLYDIEEVHGRSDDYVERVGNAVKNWDYLISPSEYASKAFRSAFRYKGEILQLGYPRNDIFYKDNKEEIIKKVKNRLHLPRDKKIILYAPTFRDDQTTKKNKFVFDIQMDLHKMKKYLSDDYIILLRMHVVISNKIQVNESLSDFVKNVSNYSDIQELLLLSDILITDYSSVMFDFANTGRPMIFYTYDLENYRDNLRGFYMDFEKEVPGPLAFNTDDIIQSILNIDEITKRYSQKYKEFQTKFCSLEDGKASMRVVDKLFK